MTNPNGAAVQVCYFHEGQHFGPPGCYHEQFPEEYPPGWNVQLEDRFQSSSYWNSPDDEYLEE